MLKKNRRLSLQNVAKGVKKRYFLNIADLDETYIVLENI